MGKAIRKGEQIVLTLSIDEAELVAAILLEQGHYKFGPTEKETVVSLNTAVTPPKPASPRTYTCQAVGCYKFGHSFTEKGWNGDPAKGIKGHTQVSSYHR